MNSQESLVDYLEARISALEIELEKDGDELVKTKLDLIDARKEIESLKKNNYA
tara:strand:- start:3684 stop:3842 length:159 start_codon:yes stop_codon:yes gene_type:complete